MQRGWLGVSTRDGTTGPEGKNDAGPVIMGVVRGGPADAAGIKAGDVVLGVNDKPVSDSIELVNLISAIKPGETAQLRIARAGREQRLGVRVGTRPPVQRKVQ